MKFDEYRVNLFKQKLRAMLPEIGGLRFYRSKGRCHLVIDLWRYYGQEDEVGSYISDRFRQARVEFKEDRHTWGTQKLHAICIPIDQEALPERKSSNNARAKTKTRRCSFPNGRARKARNAQKETGIEGGSGLSRLQDLPEGVHPSMPWRALHDLPRLRPVRAV